jgi:hypothetical protein
VVNEIERSIGEWRGPDECACAVSHRQTPFGGCPARC